MSLMPERERIRVGNAGGYWGDDLGALHQQLTRGPLDYVTQDFLAEITMSILQKQRSRDSRLGYAVDFLDQVRPCLSLLEESGTRLISNAGGINPAGCAEALARMARRDGIRLALAVVEGDDLMDRLAELSRRGIALENLESGQPFSAIADRVLAANAYLGAVPVIQALRRGAQLIITGRVTDTGIAVAPPVFEFDWDLEDWDRLASAVVAGHILECGAQASGGNLSDWREVPALSRIGYPIAEFERDGSFVVTKHDSSGGLVNRKTVTSQLIYEMGNPQRYVTPDVVADFSTIQLREEGEQRVRVGGVRGRPRPDQLKVSISYRSGYKAHGTLLVSAPEAVDKSRAVADIFWRRLEFDFEDTSTELVGYNASHRHLALAGEPPEILLRLGVRDPEREKVEEFARKFTSLILSTVPGVAIVGARPRVQDVVAYWPCLIPASEVTPQVTLLDSGQTFQIPWEPVPPQAPPLEDSGKESAAKAAPSPPESPGRTLRVPLIRLCYARSGDKGDTANIGVVARSRPIYHWLRAELTAARIKEYFGELCRGEVERFEVPNLLALNFLLHQSLGGGGTVSLRIDPQGKTLADALLMMGVEIEESLLLLDR